MPLTEKPSDIVVPYCTVDSVPVFVSHRMWMDDGVASCRYGLTRMDWEERRLRRKLRLRKNDTLRVDVFI
jgi:hypothetical protein